MTANLRIKGNRYYGVINYKEGSKHKQKWFALGLTVKNNKRKAEEMLETIVRQYSDNYATPTSDMLFSAYVKQWLAKKKPYVELSTWEGYRIYAEKHIIPYFESLKISLKELKPKHLQDYYQYKYTDGRLDNKEGGLSIASIKKHRIVIKEALDDAVLEDLIVRNPAIGIKLPGKNIPMRNNTFLTAEEANKVVAAFEGHPLHALVAVTLYYGLRRSEALGLKWSAIDFVKNTVTINHTVVKNVSIVYKDTTKTQASCRTYALIDNVKTILLKVKEEQNKNRIKFGRAYKNSDYVFTWEDGTLFRPDYVTRGFQRVLKHHNLPPMRFHDLRHSTASILHDKGWSLEDIKTWLGHASIEVTSDIYVHITNDRKARMAEKLNEMF